MAQIKYIVYACLLFFAGAACLMSAKVFFTTPLVQESPTSVLVDEVTQTKEEKKVSSKGKTLFQQNCQGCHSLNKTLTGPALAGVTERGPWTEKENMYKWLQNPAAFIPTTAYTRDLQKQFGGQVMPAFPQLSKEEVNELLKYFEGGL